MNSGHIVFERNDLAKVLYGAQDENLRMMEKIMGVEIHVRGNTLNISGDPEEVAVTERILTDLYTLLVKGYPLYPDDVERAALVLRADSKVRLDEIFMDTVLISHRQRRITPRSLMQKKYVEAIRKYDIVFGIGPAGTGKTYLAMAMAVNALNKKDVERIILTRPAVEAGEKLGFLPGDIYEKVNPYLRPLYDALYDMMDYSKAISLIERGVIEVAPLAFMRGRTLNDSFVILDEAQNTTSEQMLMFLTRLGFSSKAVITGDITQVDLPDNKVSGLVEAGTILKDIPGIAFLYFTEKDVVRHKLVQEIIKAYDEARGRNDNHKETLR